MLFAACRDAWQDGILRGDWQLPLLEYRHRLRQADYRSAAGYQPAPQVSPDPEDMFY
jgi:hypothetical protein